MAAFPVTTPNYLAKIPPIFFNAEFNSASIDTKFVKVRQTELYIVCHFLLAVSRFLANLLKFGFSVFPEPSGRVAKFFPVPDDGQKLGGTFKKKNEVRTPSGTALRAKKKKRYFIIYREYRIYSHYIYIDI